MRARSWIGVLFALVILSMTYECDAQQDPSFFVVNRSSRQIFRIHVYPASTMDLGRDWLGDAVLMPGQRFRVEPVRDGTCVFNVRIVYEDGQYEERGRVNLCAINELAFDGGFGARASSPTAVPSAPVLSQERQAEIDRSRRAPPAATVVAPARAPPNADFDVVNRSSQLIVEVFVTRNAMASWGEDRLPGTIRPGDRFHVQLPRDGVCEYDVRVVYQDRTSAERRRQNLCSISEMVFR
jgi:hypothetical protein